MARASADSFSDFLRPPYPEQGFRPDRCRRRFVDTGRVTIYCPDSIDLDSFYNKGDSSGRSHAHAQRLRERDRRTTFSISRGANAQCHRVGVCGASLGAYHAANIAFRHPDAVSHLISLSGAFEISDFFDGYHDENIYFNSPYQYLPNMPDPWKFNHMSIIIGTGEWDNTRHE